MLLLVLLFNHNKVLSLPSCTNMPILVKARLFTPVVNLNGSRTRSMTGLSRLEVCNHSATLMVMFTSSSFAMAFPTSRSVPTLMLSGKPFPKSLGPLMLTGTLMFLMGSLLMRRHGMMLFLTLLMVYSSLHLMNLVTTNTVQFINTVWLMGRCLKQLHLFRKL